MEEKESSWFTRQDGEPNFKPESCLINTYWRQHGIERAKDHQINAPILFGKLNNDYLVNVERDYQRTLDSYEAGSELPFYCNPFTSLDEEEYQKLNDPYYGMDYNEHLAERGKISPPDEINEDYIGEWDEDLDPRFDDFNYDAYYKLFVDTLPESNKPWFQTPLVSGMALTLLYELYDTSNLMISPLFHKRYFSKKNIKKRNKLPDHPNVHNEGEDSGCPYDYFFNKEECSDEFIEALQEHICRIFDSCFEKDYRKLMLFSDRSRGYKSSNNPVASGEIDFLEWHCDKFNYCNMELIGWQTTNGKVDGQISKARFMMRHKGNYYRLGVSLLPPDHLSQEEYDKIISQWASCNCDKDYEELKEEINKNYLTKFPSKGDWDYRDILKICYAIATNKDAFRLVDTIIPMSKINDRKKAAEQNNISQARMMQISH